MSSEITPQTVRVYFLSPGQSSSPGLDLTAHFLGAPGLLLRESWDAERRVLSSAGLLSLPAVARIHGHISCVWEQCEGRESSQGRQDRAVLAELRWQGQLLVLEGCHSSGWHHCSAISVALPGARGSGAGFGAAVSSSRASPRLEAHSSPVCAFQRVLGLCHDHSPGGDRVPALSPAR